MLTRMIRIQLILFVGAALVGTAAMALVYLQAPTMLGIGRINVKLELPASGGLYKYSNVTYRGIQVGKVTDLEVVDGRRVVATMSLPTSPKIPADLIARVRSVSAVGEQYVDLQPAHDAPPYLRDGSVIDVARTAVPEPVGPMLDQLDALVGSIPKEKLGPLLDETSKAFGGAGYDIGSLLDSSSTVLERLDAVADQNRALVTDSVPLLDAQATGADALRQWAHGLAGVTGSLTEHDDGIRTLLRTGPGAAQEVSRLLEQVKPTLPVLLANLTSLGQVFVTYNGSMEQLLVLFPPYVAGIQSVAPVNNPTGKPMGDFAVSVSDPPSCTVGFLPPSQWRPPEDTTDMDTPDGLYCKLPQDAPIDVRGARNFPCVEHPGKRAATVQDCNSDKPFQPLAMRQHALGPYPFDPNLVSQGIPVDSRVDGNDRIFGPTEGSPMPGPAPGPGPDTPPPPPTPTGPVAPSSFTGPGAGPPFATATYNPRTGSYLGTDGRLWQQSNLSAAGPATSWTDLMPIGA